MKKLLALVLTAVLLTALVLLTTQAATTTNPKQIITWESFYQNASGSNTAVVVTRETDYLQCQINSVGNNTLGYTITKPNLLATGDSALIRVVARAVGSAGKMRLDLGNSSTDTVAVPTAWTEYFFPLSVSGYTNSLYVYMGQQKQTIQIRDLEVVNCGALALDDLPEGTRDASVEAVVTTSSVTTKTLGGSDTSKKGVTGAEGIFERFYRLTVSAIAQNPTQRGMYWELTNGEVEKGDVCLVRLIVRAANSDGSDSQLRLSLRSSTDSKAVSSVDYTIPSQWTEIYVPLSLAGYNPNRLMLYAGHQVQAIDIAKLEIYNYGDADISALPTGYRILVDPTIEPTPEETTEPPMETIMKKDFTEELAGTLAKDKSASYTFQSGDITIKNGNMMMFSTVVQGQSAAQSITITAKFKSSTTEMQYYVPVQATRINMPITARGDLVSFTVKSETGTVVISEAIVENRGSATQDDLLVESGMHMLEENYTLYKLDETGVGAGKATDLVASGNFIYTIGSGNLVVTDVTNPDKPVVRGKIDGLGETRQIELCKSGTDVMVTARAYGAWIIDVSNPDEPVIRAQYDSIELATGICIEGDYAYISCRNYGVDVVDLSDLDNPKHVCILRTGEVQSCEVVDNILYAGLWSQCRVDMFDISDPANSVLLGQVKLSGKGDGTAIYKKDGKIYLFAATGHHPLSLGSTEPLSDLRYGQGNGMDIFDVTDPANPIWLSTSKTDGRHYGPSNDFWSVELAEDEDGHLYAYLASTYNGAYIYDVESMTAPIRKAHIIIEVPKTSQNFQDLHRDNRTIAYPFDIDEINWSPVGRLASANGRLYIAAVTTDLFIMKNEDLFYNQPNQPNSTVIDASDMYEFDGAGLPGYTAYRGDMQIHAVIVWGDYVVAAGSSKGILFFNENLELVKTVPTENCCYDVQIKGDTLYSADGVGGLVAYKMDGLELTEQWRYVPGRTVKQVRLSETGKFAVLHLASTRGVILRTTDQKAVVSVATSSQMYHHSVVNEVVAGRYLGFWAYSSNECWYDFGENDCYDVPVKIREYKPLSTTAGGIEAVGNLALQTTNNGYFIYDPATTESNTNPTYYKANGKGIAGRPSEHNGLLITTNRPNGKIYITDISNITSPKLLKSFEIAGNPMIAAFSDTAVYIPMGYQGIMKFDLAEFDPQENQPAFQVGSSQYTTLEQAAAAGGVIEVLRNVNRAQTLTQDAYLDLNGYSLSNITVAEGATLYLLDSQTDDYEGAYGTAKVTGSVESFVTANDKTYLVVADENGLYSAHRYAVAITHISLDASNDALGYKAQFFGDEVAQSHVVTMGFNLWVTEAKVMSCQKDGVTSVTLRLKNILAASGGEMTINGNAFVIFDIQGKTETSETCQTSMKEVLQIVNNNWDSYSETQKQSVKALVEKFQTKLEGWNLDNILVWTTE